MNGKCLGPAHRHVELSQIQPGERPFRSLCWWPWSVVVKSARLHKVYHWQQNVLIDLCRALKKVLTARLPLWSPYSYSILSNGSQPSSSFQLNLPPRNSCGWRSSLAVPGKSGLVAIFTQGIWLWGNRSAWLQFSAVPIAKKLLTMVGDLTRNCHT